MSTQMPPPPRPPSSEGTNRYLVSYDLLGNPSHQRYEQIDSVLKSKYRATEVLLSDWILNTEESGPSIFNTLRGLIQSDDRLLVVTITGNPIIANRKR